MRSRHQEENAKISEPILDFVRATVLACNILYNVYTGLPVSARQPTFSSTSLATQVYDHLLRKIATGDYQPGHLLRESELSEELGVSRTPVREALLRLIEYGMVEGTGRSAQVRRMSTSDVVHLFQVRRALELEAVRLACGKLTSDDFARLAAADPGEPTDDPEFAHACQRFDFELHRTIAERSGNPLLALKIRKLHDRVQLVCRPTVERLIEHRVIIEALRAEDCRASRRAMARHLTLACRSQLKQLRKAARPGG